MALTKIKIGEFVSLINEKNTKGNNLPFLGLNKDKMFMPTVATIEGLENKKYKIVRQGYFVYSGMQTGRDNCIRLGYYTDDNPSLISPAYTTFVVNENIIIPEYFFMFFNSNEKDRYGAFLSDGSIRSNLDWNFFCNIDMNLPSIEIQKKYVDIYKSIKENLSTYERRINDIKLASQASIEYLKDKKLRLHDYIEKVNIKNESNIKNVVGISNKGFMKTKNQSKDLHTYNVVTKGCFVYNPSAINLGSIDLYEKESVAVCSPIYVVFKVKEEKELNKDFLNIWLHRADFFRSTEFYSMASVRNNFTFELMQEVKIPMPPIEVQNSIAELYSAYNKCKEIIDKLKQELNEVCKILIKGATSEAMASNLEINESEEI